jgi:hypothetical protein
MPFPPRCSPPSPTPFQTSSSEGLNLPLSTQQWDEAIKLHFFSKEASGSSQPIRYIQADEETLARAAARLGADVEPKAAVASFRASFNPYVVQDVLSGNHVPRGGFYPCARYLFLTLHVESALDDEDEGVGAFRSKLSEFFGGWPAFSNLAAVNQRWREFAKWLESGQGEATGLRQLTLPEFPSGWTQIGITKRLVFPTKRDFSALRAMVGDGRHLINDPRRLLFQIRSHARLKTASHAFRLAFSDFDREFQASRRTLAETDFWRFVTAAVPRAGSVDVSQAHFDLVAHQLDDGWQFVLIDREQRHEMVVGAIDTLVERISTSDRPQGYRQGLVVFAQSGYGEWHALLDWEDCAGQLRIAVKEEFAERAGLAGGIKSGSWRFAAAPISVAALETLAARLGIAFITSARIRRVETSDGVRTEGAWLGIPWMLPTISVPLVNLAIEVSDVQPAATDVSLIDAQNDCAKLTSTEAFNGIIDLEASSRPDATPFWSRRLRFVAEAFEHKEPAPGGSSATWQVLDDLQSPLSLGPCKHAPTPSGEGSGIVDEAVEAIYAAGRCGFAEGELLKLLQRVPEPSSKPWALLHLLHQSSVIVPRLRPQWGGRHWTIQPLMIDTIGADGCVIASGALTARMRERFVNAVEQLGGHAASRRGRMLEVTLVAGSQVDPIALHDRLGWPLRQAVPRTTQRAKPEMTDRTLSGLAPTHSWAWSRLGFSESHNSDTVDGAAIVRHAHPEGRFQSVYAVGHGAAQKRTYSFAAALLVAARRRKTALFRWNRDSLRPVSPSIRLPIEAALALRARHTSNPWLENGSLVYPCEEPALRRLAELLGPTLFERSAEASQRNLPPAGRRYSRPVWNAADGKVGWTMATWGGA